MPRNPNTLPAGVRLSDKLALAQLHRFFPLETVRQALKTENRETMRMRELPNEFMAYYPIILCLYRDASQQEVLRVMTDGLDYLFGLKEFKVTGKSGISQARARVGSGPLASVFESCAKPIAKEDARGCFYKGLRLTALDGSDLDLDDCEDNHKYFGRNRNQHSDGPFPKARVVGLVEVGTKAIFGLSIGLCLDSEIALAKNVIPKLEAGMLCIADRLFMSFELYKTASEQGAQLLFRARLDRNLEREEVLPDGSYLSTIYAHTDRKKEKGIRVRVLDSDVDVEVGGIKSRQSYRFITTLFDWKTYPLVELVELYRQRWEIETMLAEVKTHLMGSQPLRSRTAELVKQEIYGMFMAHYAIRRIMYEAAYSEKLDPDDLSFTHSRNVLERNMPKFGIFPPSTVS